MSVKVPAAARDNKQLNGEPLRGFRASGMWRYRSLLTIEVMTFSRQSGRVPGHFTDLTGTFATTCGLAAP